MCTQRTHRLQQAAHHTKKTTQRMRTNLLETERQAMKSTQQTIINPLKLERQVKKNAQRTRNNLLEIKDQVTQRSTTTIMTRDIMSQTELIKNPTMMFAGFTPARWMATRKKFLLTDTTTFSIDSESEIGFDLNFLSRSLMPSCRR